MDAMTEGRISSSHGDRVFPSLDGSREQGCGLST